MSVCLGRPHTHPRCAKSTRSHPGEICTPVCCSRYAASRSEVQASNVRPTALGGVSSAVSMAAR